jgi:nucleotide-binding universal stress UspA family protein
VTAFGDPARTIVDYVDDEAVDLVVMGSHGRSLVSRALIGDTAYTVVRRASAPVTLVR